MNDARLNSAALTFSAQFSERERLLRGRQFALFQREWALYAPPGHKPASWIHDALFQPESRARYRNLFVLGYTDAFRSLHPREKEQFTFWA